MSRRQFHPQRRFVLTFVTSTLIGLVGMASLNLAVDPFGAFGLELLPADSRSGDTRTARAERLRRFAGETVLIGSSRTRVGYDGRHPAIPGGPALNVGLDGTHLRELANVVDHALANPHVRRIVLSLDWHLCAADWRPNADFECSRFNPRRSQFEHLCDLLWNGRTTEASLRALRRYLADAPRMHDDWGFARHAELKFDRTSQAARTIAALRQFGGQGESNITLQSPATSRLQLQQMLTACRARNVEVTIVIDPLHMLLLEGLRRDGAWSMYCDWKRDVVSVADTAGVPVWDFTTSSRYLTEPLLAAEAAESRWFWEPSHMRRELGDRILSRVFHAADADPALGVRLTPQNLPQEALHAAAAAATWRGCQPAEVARLAAVRGDSGVACGESPVVTADAPAATSPR